MTTERGSERTTTPDTTPESAQIVAILAAHDGRAQNVEGDWLCACGSFLCPPNDARLNRCHREHIATILSRRVFVSVPPASTVCDREYGGRHYFSIDGSCQRCGVSSSPGGSADGGAV